MMSRKRAPGRVLEGDGVEDGKALVTNAGRGWQAALLHGAKGMMMLAAPDCGASSGYRAQEEVDDEGMMIVGDKALSTASCSNLSRQ